jgi:hypothetical protein
MMKYLIYIAIAALVVWAVVYLVRHIRRQMKGDCGACGGGCDGCGGSCRPGEEKK